MKETENKAWIQKYFTLAIDWNLHLLKFKKDTKVSKFISIKIHIIIKEGLDKEKITVKIFTVITRSLDSHEI